MRPFLVFRSRFPLGGPEELGTVVARDQADAVAQAMRRFDVPPSLLLVAPASRRAATTSRPHKS